jgi:hypothetical protein
VGGFRNQQGLAQTRMREAEIVVRVVHNQLLAHAGLAVTERVDPPAHRRYALANVQVEPVTVDE